MLNYFNELENFDADVFAACNKELDRQQTFIELIASENIVSKAVLLAAVPFVQLQYGLRVCSAIHIHSCALPSPCYTVFFAFNPVQQVFRLVAQVPVVAVLAIDVQCRDNRVYRYYVGMPLR